MKKYYALIAAAFAFCATAHAAKLETQDLVGTIFIVDQQTGVFQGILKMADDFAPKNHVTFQGQVNGKKLNCQGRAAFDQVNQTLHAFMNCGRGMESKLTVLLRDASVTDFLRGTFVNAGVSFHVRTNPRHGWSTEYFNRSIDLKKIN